MKLDEPVFEVVFCMYAFCKDVEKHTSRKQAADNIARILSSPRSWALNPPRTAARQRNSAGAAIEAQARTLTASTRTELEHDNEKEDERVRIFESV